MVNNEKQKEYNEKYNSYKGANLYKRWTKEELALAFDYTKTDLEIGQLLQRSSKAVANKRIKHIKKLKQQSITKIKSKGHTNKSIFTIGYKKYKLKDIPKILRRMKSKEIIQIIKN